MKSWLMAPLLLFVASGAWADCPNIITAKSGLPGRFGEWTTTYDIKNGTFDPFTGPLTKQDGSVGLPAGQTLPVWGGPSNPNQLSKYTLNWFVQGVIGTIPSS